MRDGAHAETQAHGSRVGVERRRAAGPSARPRGPCGGELGAAPLSRCLEEETPVGGSGMGDSGAVCREAASTPARKQCQRPGVSRGGGFRGWRLTHLPQGADARSPCIHTWSGSFSEDSFDFGTNSIDPSPMSAVHHVTTLITPIFCFRGGLDSLFHKFTFVTNKNTQTPIPTILLK